MQAYKKVTAFENMTDLEWSNLKELKCAKCYADLESHPTIKTLLICSDKSCNFSISKSKIRDIVVPMFNESGDHFGRAEFEEMMKNP